MSYNLQHGTLISFLGFFFLLLLFCLVGLSWGKRPLVHKKCFVLGYWQHNGDI